MTSVPPSGRRHVARIKTPSESPRSNAKNGRGLADFESDYPVVNSASTKGDEAGVIILSTVIGEFGH
jgi:hypothetical protein